MSKINSIYVIGSLRNPDIPKIANTLREQGLEVFDDWYAAGPRADDHWKEYEQGRGRTYLDALKGRAARNVFAFDRFNIMRCDAVVLVLPAGRSGHLELGFAAGKDKPCFILLPDEHDRWDVMYAFATEVFASTENLCRYLSQTKTSSSGPTVSGASATKPTSIHIAETTTK